MQYLADFFCLFGDKICSRKVATNLWNLIAPALGNNVLFEVSWTESLPVWLDRLTIQQLYLLAETQQCCQHINRANLTSWKYKGSVGTRLADESRMGCTLHCWGCLGVCTEEEVGKGRKLPLLISALQLCSSRELMDTGHGCPRVEELGEEVQEWGHGHQHRQETVQMPHPLPLTWLEWNNFK